ncbi:MAG: DUF2911 domain-containing protein [Cyclobacteriaceae bacterium]|nr:DUF2911 domain-containing protein [Cyclobacteriaceae bacterium]
MKRSFLFTLLITLFIIPSLQVNAQIGLPVASSWGSVSSTVGLTTIKIDYYRPKKKGRNIFGTENALVPFGQLWRTGANSGTVVSFQDSITFGDKKVKGGEYLLFTKPGQDSWEVMLYDDLSLGGNVNGYKIANEVAKLSVKPNRLSETVETFTITISDISEDNTTANIQLMWENTSVKIPVTVDYDSKIMAEIAAKTQVSPANYLAAANYYFQTDRDINQAVKWMELYLASTEKPPFWNLHVMAKMLVKKGDIEGARSTAQKSLDLAKASGNDFGYVKLNEELLKSLPAQKSSSKKKKKK